MSKPLDEWVCAMRRSDHAAAWAISERAAALRPPAERDNPALPYHLRWVWDLRPFDGRDVLVRCYHGLGDSIQFLRFLPLLRRRVASVTLEIQPALVPLVQGGDWADRVVPFDETRPLPPAECDMEIMELSFALRAAPALAPAPYLRAQPSAAARGAIGLCWQAGDWNPGRALPPELLAPLCHGRDCVALVPGASPLPVRNPQGSPDALADTARLIAGCALVITVDTMVAHLAGALGVPTWLLLKHDPDWRWTPDTGRSEWYPSMRLYTQPAPGDWDSVIAAVRRDLDRAALPLAQPSAV